jgi:TrmH family RNA methyltransferase
LCHRDMITSLTNPQVKHVRRLHSQKGRQQAQRFIAEGLRLVEEALRAGSVPALMFYTPRLENTKRGQALLALVEKSAVQPMLVSEKVMRAMATTTTPQSVLGVLPMPKAPWSEHPTLLLVLDRLRDPGNLGSVLRTAEAAGVDGVLLAPGTVDAYNPKTVRGGMGAHFWLALRAASWHEIEELTEGLQIWLAEARGGLPYYEIDWSRPLTLIIGGEADGASAEGQRLTDGRVSIPITGQAESLNAAVAAGIILFEAAHQRSLAQKPLLC